MRSAPIVHNGQKSWRHWRRNGAHHPRFNEGLVQNHSQGLDHRNGEAMGGFAPVQSR